MLRNDDIVFHDICNRQRLFAADRDYFAVNEKRVGVQHAEIDLQQTEIFVQLGEREIAVK